MGDQRPIGIFDSGVGGLTVLKEIRERLPLEPTIYVADLLHFPYGPRYQDEVRGFAIDIIRYLESRDVKLVVIACNTATAAALNQARELFELPIIGVISPGAQAAVETTRNNRIGVISTEGTMRSQEYLHAIKEIDPMVGVYQKACPELVEIVEAGEADSPRAERVLRDNLADIVRLGADTLVLGCTHYPLLKPAINRVYPGSFELIDSATTTASKVERHLDHSRLRATDGSPRHEVLVTDFPKHFDEIAANLFGEAIEAEEVPIWEPQKTLEIFGPVALDLADVEAALRDGIRHDPDEVGAPMADLFAAGGKRVRPALVLLAARCGSYDLDRLNPAAMAVELTHAATLVHDDVIDRSAMRRGRPTVAASLGDEPAIVIGDFYFAKAYEHAARTHSTEVVGILARAVMEICAGEVRQQAIRYQYSTGVDEYMQRIESKTATLLAASCDIGAALAGVSPGLRSGLHEYGRMLGLAFQIADDVLDYLGSEGEIGKPIGKDITEGFATLPLMLAMEDESIAHHLTKVLQDGRELNASEAGAVVEMVRRSGAPQRALERARQYASAASRQADGIAAKDVRDALDALAGYVVSRKL